jgi:Tfp pilus assembly protein FimT
VEWVYERTKTSKSLAARETRYLRLYLVELLVVIAIVAILAALLPSLAKAKS